jgi:hypothetical protein
MWRSLVHISINPDRDRSIHLYLPRAGFRFRPSHEVYKQADFAVFRYFAENHHFLPILIADGHRTMTTTNDQRIF